MKELNETQKSVFDVLSAINCNEHTEKKNGLTYLSWAWAWGIVKKQYSSANYEVTIWDGRPYLFDDILGYMVQTTVSIDGEKIGMQLPVMDGANKAQRNVPYTYKTKYGDKSVEAASMFDINTAIMRCLTKNLAMFGLGHYIYAGEDLPQDNDNTTLKPEPNIPATKPAAKQSTVTPPKPVVSEPDPDMLVATQEVKEAKTMPELLKVYGRWTGFQKNPDFLKIMSDRKTQLLNNA